MSFLTSDLANKAKITILSARDTTWAWVPGRGIMGRNVGVYKNGYNTWFSSRLQTQPRSFRFVLINFPFAVRVMSVTKDEVLNETKANNDQWKTSFKELLNDTAGQIKRTNDTSAEPPTKEIKELKFQEPLKFKKKSERRPVQVQS